MSTDPLRVLAAADPARGLPDPTPGDLDQIRARVATPNLTHTSRRPTLSRISRRTLALALLAFVLASAALASGYHPWKRDEARQIGPGASGHEANDVFQREYATAQRALSLPPDAKWPTRSVEPNTVIPTGRGGLGESTAVLAALGLWECYVVDQYDAGNSAGVRTGLTALTDLVDNHIVDVPPGTPEDGAAPSSLPGPIAQFAAGNEPTAARFHRMINEAAAGEPRGLREFCDANR